MTELDALTLAFLRSHPEGAAQVLEAAPAKSAADLFARTPVRIGAPVLGQMLPPVAARVITSLDEDRALMLLSALDRLPLIAILRHVTDPARTKFIEGLPAPSALASRLLLAYPDYALGAYADPDVVALAAHTRVDDALQRVRNMDAGIDRVFVLNEDRRLCGWASLDRLLRAPLTAQLGSIMLPTTDVIAANAPLATVQSHPGWLVTSALPVVDPKRRLIGIMTRDAFERARSQLHRQNIPAAHEGTLTEVALSNYWNALSGLVESILSLLPSVPRIVEKSNER